MCESCGAVTPIIIIVCVVIGVIHVVKLWLGDPINIIVCVVTGVIHVDKLWLGDPPPHFCNSMCCYGRDTCGQAVAG